MSKFTDAKNREWNVEISVHSARLVKDRLDYDLLTIKDGREFAMLVGDPLLIVGTLFVLLEAQVKEANLDEEKFYSGFQGETVERGTDALVKALVDFLPAKRRALLEQMWNATLEIQRQEIEATTKFLDSPELQAEIDKHLARRYSVLTVNED